MKKIQKQIFALSLSLLLLLSIAGNTIAAEQSFKKGLAYLLSGATVYSNAEAREPLFQVMSDTGVYVLENATGGSTLKSDDILKVTIAVDGKAQDVYAWAFDVQYMSKRQISSYNPGKGAGTQGIILGNAVIGDAPTPKPVITRDPSKVIVTAPPTQKPVSGQRQSTSTPRKNVATPTPKAVVTPTPVVTPEPVFPAFIAVQPSQITGTLGAPATVRIIAENVVKYQWQFKENDKDWMNLPNNSDYAGSQTAEMTLVLTEENTLWKYRCVVNGAENSLISDEVDVALSTALYIIEQPKDAVAAVGGEAVFVVKAANMASCVWQYESGEDEWTDLEQAAAEMPDATTAQLTIPVTENEKGKKIRCHLIGVEGDELDTESASIITGAAAIIITQPTDAVAANGSTAVFHVEAENAISYQWQYDDGISGWWDLVERDDRVGTTTDTLTLNVRPTVASFTYRCVITGAENTVESKSVSIIIK